MSHFEKVKEYLVELEYTIVSEDPAEELVIVEKPESGITNLLVDAEDPILVIEYPLFKLSNPSNELLLELLKKNRDIVHGAFAITDDKTLIFRDTLMSMPIAWQHAELANFDLSVPVPKGALHAP